jgi:hypothetical protein
VWIRFDNTDNDVHDHRYVNSNDASVNRHGANDTHVLQFPQRYRRSPSQLVNVIDGDANANDAFGARFARYVNAIP